MGLLGLLEIEYSSDGSLELLARSQNLFVELLGQLGVR